MSPSRIGALHLGHGPKTSLAGWVTLDGSGIPTLEVRAGDGVGDLFTKHVAANEMPLCCDGSAIVVASYVPIDQRCLNPGARKIKQTLPLIFGFGAGSGNHCLFGV